jgi:hypothetical protein
VLPWDRATGEICQEFCSWQPASDLGLLGFNSFQQSFIEEYYVLGRVPGSVGNREVNLIGSLSLRIHGMVEVADIYDCPRHLSGESSPPLY